MQAEKSVTVERNKRGVPIALLSDGKRYPVKRGSFEIPGEIAGRFMLGNLSPEIIIDFVDRNDYGIVFRAIQQVKGNQGEVVVMVRHTWIDWRSPLRLGAYAKGVEALIKDRERSKKDVNYLLTHIHPEQALISFVAKVNGTTVGGLLINARKIAEEIISPLKKLEQKVDEEIKMMTSSATDDGAGSKQDLKKN